MLKANSSSAMIAWAIGVSLLLYVLSAQAFAASYFVTTTGNDNNKGLIEADAWGSLSYAVEHLQAGDSVYIKAGLYPLEQISIRVSGTPENPISLIGYSSIPGDIDPVVLDPHKKTIPNMPDAKTMPLFDGKRQKSSSIGLYIGKQKHIEVKNLQFTGYFIGVSVNDSEHIVLDNISVANSWGKISYTGFGFSLVNTDHSQLRNCMAISNEGENISLFNSNHNIIENCQSHGGFPGDDKKGFDGTDYYIIVAGSHHNLIRNCLAQRHSGIHHGGHGIGFKANGELTFQNRVENSVTRGMAEGFFAGHSKTFNNTFVNCTAYGDDLDDQDSTRGFVVREGAHNNHFKACQGHRLDHGIEFLDNLEDPAEKQKQQYNVFSECKLTDSLISVVVFTQSASNNTIDQLRADTAPRLFSFPKASSTETFENNRLQNSHIKNIPDYSSGSGHVESIRTMFVNSAQPD